MSEKDFQKVRKQSGMGYLIVQLFFSCGTGCRKWVIRLIIALAVPWRHVIKGSPAEEPNRNTDPSPAQREGLALCFGMLRAIFLLLSEWPNQRTHARQELPPPALRLVDAADQKSSFERCWLTLCFACYAIAVSRRHFFTFSHVWYMPT